MFSWVYDASKPKVRRRKPRVRKKNRGVRTREGHARPIDAGSPRFFFLTRGLRLRTLGLVVGAMVSVHGAEIDELMVCRLACSTAHRSTQ
jgi:hypothetical protein